MALDAIFAVLDGLELYLALLSGQAAAPGPAQQAIPPRDGVADWRVRGCRCPPEDERRRLLAAAQ
eukprot:10935967-Alexandrium_andersonii.AAC.1